MAEPARTGALSIGAIAKRSGTAVSTLHFYESRGLIASDRSGGNQRRYSQGVLRRIAVIRLAQQAGLPLSLIGNALARFPADHILTEAEWGEFAAWMREHLDQRIESLLQLRNGMQRCIGSGCLSLADCMLRNPGDSLSVEGTGPRLLGRLEHPGNPSEEARPCGAPDAR